MTKNIFEGAKFGDKFICRNGTVAYYCRYVEEEHTHTLMVQDDENDFVFAYDDGHIFHIDNEWKDPKNGKTICEIYGWNYEDVKDFRLDIVSRYEEHNHSWIKCSDKLPEEIDCETIIISPHKKREWTVSDDVLVQDNHGNVYVDRLVNGKWTVKYEPDYDGNEYVVVAWMPIPDFMEE